MNSKSHLGIELVLKGLMILVPLLMLRSLFAKFFGKYAVQSLGFIDLGIAFAFLVLVVGVGIIVWSLFRSRK